MKWRRKKNEKEEKKENKRKRSGKCKDVKKQEVQRGK